MTRPDLRPLIRSMFPPSTAATSPAIWSPVSAACRGMGRGTAGHLQGDFDGILDCVTILDESLARTARRPAAAPAAQPKAARPRGRHDRAVSTIHDAAGDGVDPHHQPDGPGGRGSALATPSTPRPTRRAERCSPSGRPGSGRPARRMCRTRTATTRRFRAAHQALAISQRCRAVSPSRWISRFLLRKRAQAAVDRLPRRASTSSTRLLRPARLRGAADQPVRHRQGRRADRALVPARPPDRRDRLPRRAALVVGLDVRVPDAAAGHEGAAGRHPQPDQPADHRAARSSYGRQQGHSLGHLGSRPTMRATAN